MSKNKYKSPPPMTREEKLAHFERNTADIRARHAAGEPHQESAMVIAVRHFTHPADYALGREFMKRGAAMLEQEVDADGVWPPCRGELWLDAVLALPPENV